MSRGHQLVIATGRLGADPVTRAPQSGGLITELRIAVTEVFKDRAGANTEHTEWLRAKCFGRAAEIAQQYLAKGHLVGIEGKLHTEKWQDATGQDRYSTWIYIKPNGLTLYGGNDHERTSQAHAGRAERKEKAPEPQPVEDFADDDIPF